MMQKKLTKNALIMAGIILLAFAFFWLSNSPQKILGVDIGSTNKKIENAPFAIARNASTQHFNDSGALDYQFTAKKVEHYRDDEDDISTNYTLIFSPYITIFQENTPWLIEAKKGKILSDGLTIELWDEVVIKQSDRSGSVTQLLTSKLEIYPQKKTAISNETVTIVSPKGKITGTGMTANFTERTIKLLANVRGIHEPI